MSDYSDKIEQRRSNPELSNDCKNIISAMKQRIDVFQPETDLLNLHVKISANRTRIVCSVREFNEKGRAAFADIRKLTNPIFNEGSGIYFSDEIVCRIFGTYADLPPGEQQKKPAGAKILPFRKP